VPNVLAIYARENGQGMAFPVEAPAGDANDVLPSAQDEHEDVPGGPAEATPEESADETSASAPEKSDDGAGKGSKGHLKIVK
jgi:stringent starvation protein B